MKLGRNSFADNISIAEGAVKTQIYHYRGKPADECNFASYYSKRGKRKAAIREKRARLEDDERENDAGAGKSIVLLLVCW
jgi:hypothetical protein